MQALFGPRCVSRVSLLTKALEAKVPSVAQISVLEASLLLLRPVVCVHPHTSFKLNLNHNYTHGYVALLPYSIVRGVDNIPQGLVSPYWVRFV